ncbi:glycerophosphodiester phosphodiesterase family protein [Devosia sp. FKR38]|uniref:glycerophosphodiester phosphodiesterase n=1 Tax=Devosia sp. FKR38 TaxID=2562312 RepID=UPI0010C03F17|nr:glycerophosphodiester phosphodiesterase family protein [Devosia sp. FKR38]
MALILPTKAPGAFIAHRGASAHAPENTLAAYHLAADAGFGWIEVDTQLSSDGRAVMMHDPTVDRTTDGHGHVCALDLAALRDLDAARVLPGQARQQIPTLEETIACVLDRDLGLVLEIKPIWGSDIEHGRAVAAIVEAMWPRDNDKLVVSSFSASCLLSFRRVTPWASLALAADVVVANPRDYIDMLGVSAFHLNYQFALDQGVDRLLATGAQVAVATVNDADLAARLLARGIHGIMTDRIDVMTANT